MTTHKKRKIKDIIEFYLFAYGLFMLFLWPIFGNFIIATQFTLILLAIGTFLLYCCYFILSVIVWIEKEARIEFILRSPIAIRRRQL